VAKSPSRLRLPEEEVFEFRAGRYAFVGIRLADYAQHARPISHRWDTLAMPAVRFRELAQSMEAWLGLECPVAP